MANPNCPITNSGDHGGERQPARPDATSERGRHSCRHCLQRIAIQSHYPLAWGVSNLEWLVRWARICDSVPDSARS
nr:hypothetical protein Iba_chr09cCG3530 [Ipomoea batatas]